MDYDTYGSGAIELAIDLANVDRTGPEWARAFLASHDEWFTPGTSVELSPGETHRAGTTAELVLPSARPDAPVLEQLTTTVAMGLPRGVIQHGWQRLGVCSAGGCDNVYVAPPRNASRRYCSNTCASRSTVAAYRARQRT